MEPDQQPNDRWQPNDLALRELMLILMLRNENRFAGNIRGLGGIEAIGNIDDIEDINADNDSGYDTDEELPDLGVPFE
jgi:hypothetical protein